MQRGPPVGGIPRVDVGPLPLQQPLHLRGKGGGEVRTNSLVQRYSGAGIDAYWKLTGIDAYRNRRLQESTHNGKQSGARIDRAVSVRRNGTTASRALRMAVPCSRRGGDGAEGSGISVLRDALAVAALGRRFGRRRRPARLAMDRRAARALLWRPLPGRLLWIWCGASRRRRRCCRGRRPARQCSRKGAGGRDPKSPIRRGRRRRPGSPRPSHEKSFSTQQNPCTASCRKKSGKGGPRLPSAGTDQDA